MPTTAMLVRRPQWSIGTSSNGPRLRESGQPAIQAPPGLIFRAPVRGSDVDPSAPRPAVSLPPPAGCDHGKPRSAGPRSGVGFESDDLPAAPRWQIAAPLPAWPLSKPPAIRQGDLQSSQFPAARVPAAAEE